MFFLDSGTDCQVIKNYGTKTDKWGKVTTLFVSVPRRKPGGESTGRDDTILVEFRAGFNPTIDETCMLIEAHNLKPGEFLHFTGNLHTTNVDDENGNRKFTAKVSGKSIATHYATSARQKVMDHLAKKDEKEVAAV